MLINTDSNRIVMILMKLKSRLLVAIMSFALFSAGLLGLEAARGQETSVGVRVGDWAKYSVIGSWQSNIPGMTEPSYYQELRDILWIRSEVESVSGSVVTVALTTLFANLTETVQTLTGDLETGDGDLTLTFPLPFAPLIVESNLRAGDEIRGMFRNVTGTVSQVYAGFRRDINYAEWGVSSFGTTIGEYSYFDKTTGILCETKTATSISTMGYFMSYSVSVKVAEASMFQDQIHDVTVRDVTPSLTDVSIGDFVDFTIAVENNGTEVESFEVAVYCNSTKVWQQRLDLSEGASRSLRFTWNTTGLSKGVYMIETVAYVENDINGSDNTFMYGPLAVKEPSPWRQLNIFLYLAIGVGAILVAAFALYRRKSGQVKAELQVESTPVGSTKSACSDVSGKT